MMRKFANIDAFYAERGGERSGECDFGVWNYSDAEGCTRRWPRFRVSVVHDTGDVYALNFASLTVLLLGTLPAGRCEPHGLRRGEGCVYDVADELFAGWADEGGKPLSWFVARLPLEAVAS